MPGLAMSSPSAVEPLSRLSGGDRHNLYPNVLSLAKPWTGLVSDSVLDEVATQLTLSRTLAGSNNIGDFSLPPTPATVIRDASAPTSEQDQDSLLADPAARVVVFGLAAGLWAAGAGIKNTFQAYGLRLGSRLRRLDGLSDDINHRYLLHVEANSPRHDSAQVEQIFDELRLRTRIAFDYLHGTVEILGFRDPLLP
jgi:hypothetical protein